MDNTERKFVKLAMDYLSLAKRENVYSGERELFTDFVAAILDTLIEEDEDGGQVDQTVD